MVAYLAETMKMEPFRLNLDGSDNIKIFNKFITIIIFYRRSSLQ